MKRYADMLSLPHPVSGRHPGMSAHDRAAQFAPFAALTGYDDVIGEAGRITEPPVFLCDSALEELNSRLWQLMERLDQRPVVSMTIYRPDARKAGGAVTTVTGIVRRVDAENRVLLLEDGTAVNMDSVRNMQFLQDT